MNNELFYFKYKGNDYSLSDITSNSMDDENLSQLKDIIDNLGIRYSFKKLCNLSAKKLIEIPFFVNYKGDEFSASEMVKLNKDFEKEISRLDEFVAGEMKATSIPNMIQKGLDQSTYPIVIETLRLFHVLYERFTAAKYCLFNGYQKLHLESNIPWKHNYRSQLWFRETYVNNAILLYNSCFDILLQTIWVSEKRFVGTFINGSFDEKKFYINEIKDSNRLSQIIEECNNATDKVFTISDINDNLVVILEKCKLNAFKPKLRYLQKFRYGPGARVLDWANSLKHKNGIWYNETKYPIVGLTLPNGYDSWKTIKAEDMDSVLDALKEYQKEFAILAKKVHKDTLIRFREYGYQI